MMKQCNWATLALVYLTMQCTLKLHPSLSLAFGYISAIQLPFFGSSNCKCFKVASLLFFIFQILLLPIGGKIHTFLSHRWPAFSGPTVHPSSCKMSADGLACAVCLPATLELRRLSSSEPRGDQTARWFHLEEVPADNRSLHSLSLPTPISRQPLMVSPRQPWRAVPLGTNRHVFSGGKMECK